MRVAAPLQKPFKRIYGKPCWQVKVGYGSFLTLEFGEPHLEIREPIVAKRVSRIVRHHLARRMVTVHGDWHLWIYCCEWEVLSAGKHIGDSSTKRKARIAADSLDGRKLTAFAVSARTAQTVFKFERGTNLRTRPYDKSSEQWLLYEPSGMVLTTRADGRYSYGRSNASEDRWKPIGTTSR